MPVLSTVAAACARAWGFTAGDLFAGAALALDFDETTTLDSRITFTRATSATYFDSSGVLQTASSGAARFDHRLESGSWVNKGLLIEEQRTNICLQSENIGTTWVNANTTESLNAIDAPDGNTTADELIADVGTATVYYINQVITTSPNQTFSTSVYVKNNDAGFFRIQVQNAAASSNFIRCWFDVANGTVGTANNGGNGSGATGFIEDVGDGWYRCTLVGKPDTSGASIRVLFTVQTADGQNTWDSTGESLYLWGAQVEVGAFPTSYIATTTASVTRNADLASMTGTDFSDWYNATEGTFYAVGQSTSSTLSCTQWSASDNSSSNRLQNNINFTDPGNVIRLLVNASGSAQADISVSFTYSATSPVKAISAYKQNDIAVTANGAALGTDTSATMPSNDRLYFGARFDGATGFLNGHIAKFYYWNTRKSNSFLQNITS